jgi:FtsZ-interacting cell division protein ZipA
LHTCSVLVEGRRKERAAYFGGIPSTRNKVLAKDRKLVRVDDAKTEKNRDEEKPTRKNSEGEREKAEKVTVTQQIRTPHHQAALHLAKHGARISRIGKFRIHIL